LSGSEHEFIAGNRIRRNIGVLANLQRITASSTRCYPLFFSCTAPLKLQRFCGDDDVAR
jgi:hypothetical protein